MQAVVIALEQALDSGLKYVDIHTDSIYVIKGMWGLGLGLVVNLLITIHVNTCAYTCRCNTAVIDHK